MELKSPFKSRCESCVFSIQEFLAVDHSTPTGLTNFRGLFCARHPPQTVVIVHSEDDQSGQDRVRSGGVSYYPRCTSRACGEFKDENEP